MSYILTLGAYTVLGLVMASVATSELPRWARYTFIAIATTTIFYLCREFVSTIIDELLYLVVGGSL